MLTVFSDRLEPVADTSSESLLRHVGALPVTRRSSVLARLGLLLLSEAGRYGNRCEGHGPVGLQLLLLVLPGLIGGCHLDEGDDDGLEGLASPTQLVLPGLGLGCLALLERIAVILGTHTRTTRYSSRI